MQRTKNRIELNGKIISYYDIGEGQPILFGHSYLWDKDMWSPVIDILKKDYRCIVPDLPGHGESDPWANANLQDLAELMHDLMSALQIKSYALAGLSIGAMWGAYLVEKYPQDLSHFCILNSSLTAEPEEKVLLYKSLLSNVKQAMAMPEAIIQAIGPGFFGAGVGESVKDAFYSRLRGIFASQIETIVNLGLSFVDRGQLLDKLSGFNGKLCVVVGTQDHYRTIEEAEEISSYANCPLFKIDAGHISSLEKPEELSEIISNSFS